MLSATLLELAADFRVSAVGGAATGSTGGGGGGVVALFGGNNFDFPAVGPMVSGGESGTNSSCKGEPGLLLRHKTLANTDFFNATAIAPGYPIVSAEREILCDGG